MKVQYYNTAISELSTPTPASDVKAALGAIELAQYGARDAYMDDDYWRVIVDGKELTPEEARVTQTGAKEAQ